MLYDKFCNLSFLFSEDTPDQVSSEEDENVSLDTEVDEANVEKADEKKREGISLFNEGEFEKAVQVFTEAIKLNPGWYWNFVFVL